jgi:hypothetical protein
LAGGLRIEVEAAADGEIAGAEVLAGFAAGEVLGDANTGLLRSTGKKGQN